MNRKLLFTVVMGALLLYTGGSGVGAASWRIHNNVDRHAHFKDINAAMSSSDVVDGDTLYLDPGCTLTSNQTVSKRVTIIGTGYSLDDAVHDVASVNAALYLSAAGAKVMGVTTTKTWYVRAANVTIERCYISEVSVTAQNATIRQCRGFKFHGNGSAESAYCTIENCIFLLNSNDVPIYSLKNATIRNNYLRNSYASIDYLMQNVNESVIANNIILHVGKPNALFKSVDGVFSHNVLSCAEGTYASIPAESNLMLGEAVEENLFTLEGTALRGYQLKNGSPAKGYGDDGSDCGPYGGAYPYIPSGYPLGVPRFVSSSAGGRATDGTVSFSNQVSIQTK